MAEGQRVGTCHIQIFADDSPFRRRMQSLGRGIQEKVSVAVEAQTTGFREEIERATRTRPAKVKVEADVEGQGELASLQAFLGALRDKRVKVDVDTRPAVRAAAALNAGLASAGRSVDNFNRVVYTMGNVAQVGARMGILGLIAAVAPLTGVLTIAAAGATALAGGLGLVAATGLTSIAALVGHKQASEQAEAANQTLEDRENSLAETIESTTAAMVDARKAREQASENLRRTEIQNAEAMADAERRVADERRALDESRTDAASDDRKAEQAYLDVLAERSRVEEQNAERRRQALAELEEKDREYTKVVEENTRRLADAFRELASLERDLAEQVRDNNREEAEALDALADRREDYADLLEDNAEEERRQRQAVAEAETEVSDVIEEQNERVGESRERAVEALEAVVEGEKDLQKEREELTEKTEDLTDAQEALNQAQETEAERQRRIALGAEGAAIAYEEQLRRVQELEQERSDALAAGDTIRAGELDLEIRKAKNEAEIARLDRDAAKQEAERIANGGVSEELQQARDDVAAALEARNEQREQVIEAERRVRELEEAAEEAQAGILSARAERDEAIALAYQRVREEERTLRDLREENREETEEFREGLREQERDYRELRRENAREESELERRIREQQGVIARTIEENAERERAAAEARLKARRNLRSAEAENRRAIEENERAARDALIQMYETERQGIVAVAAQERALVESIRERRRTARQAQWEAADARAALEETQDAYEKSVLERRKQIARARDEVRTAAKEADEAAETFGAKLTASQQALLAAAISFRDAFLVAFGPAQAAFDYLAVDVLQFAERGLPYFGEIARQSVEGLAAAFRSIREEVMNPEQLATFRGFFDRVPEILRVAVAALGDFLIATFNVLAEALPFFERGLGKVAGWFDSLLRWTQSPEGKRSIREFFEDASHFAGVLADVLADVVKFLFRIGTSDQMKGIFENIAEFVDWIARNPEGVLAALTVIRRLGDVINFFLNLPFASKGIAFLAGFAATIALFAAPAIGIAIASLSGISRVLRTLTGRGILGNLRQLSGRGGLGGLSGAFSRAGAAARRFVTSLARSLLRAPAVVYRALAGVLQTVGRTFGRLPGAASRGISRFLRYVGRQLARAPRIAWDALQGMYRTVSSLFGRLWGAASRGLGRLLAFVGRQLGRVPQVAYRALSGLLRVVGGIFSRIPGIGWRALQSLGRNILAVLRGAGRWFAPLVGVVGRIFGRSGLLLRLLGFGLSGLARIFTGPAGWIFTIGQAVYEIWKHWDWLDGKFWDWIGVTKPRFLESVQDMVGRAANAVWNAVKSVGSGIAGFAKPFIDWIKDIPGTLSTWARSAFEGIGQSMVYGWIQGLADNARALYDYLVRMAKSAWDYVRGVFQVESPSKRMRWLGDMLVEGLKEGIERSTSRAVSAAARMARDVDTALSGITGPQVSLAGMSGLSGLSGIKNVVLDRRRLDPEAIRSEVYGMARREVADLERLIEKATGQDITITIPLELDGRIIDERVVMVNAGMARNLRSSKRTH